MNLEIRAIIRALGEKQLTVREILSALGLKDRENLKSIYLQPAIDGGYVALLYPASPHHPRQKYLLTVKGESVFATWKEEGLKQ